MADCTSTYGTIKQLYDRFGYFAKNVAGVAIAIVSQNPAAAVAAVKAANKLEEAIADAHKFWNDNIAKNGPLTLGPRLLELGKEQTGTIVSKGDRTFIADTPCPSESLRIRINERNGKGQTQVRACLIDPRGQHREVLQATFNDDNAEQRDEHQTVEKVVTGCKGQYLTLILDGQSLTNTMSYSLFVQAV